MKRAEELTIGIVGLGLMGAAIARALRSCGAARQLLAFDKNEDTLSKALSMGLIDESFSSPKEMLGRCDLVFLCLNPSTLIHFMEEQMGHFKEGALLTDIAGIKGNICERLGKILRKDLDFIPGHPMAGAEKGGFENSCLVVFEGKNYILTPLERNHPHNLEFLKALIRRMGFARITETTAEEHDSKIAFTSQLCHVIASALISCTSDLFPGDRAITRFGGGSFEDLTRIAMLNVPMWTELFLENREELLKSIGQFEKSLEKIKNFIKEGDGEALSETLRDVREQRMAMA